MKLAILSLVSALAFRALAAPGTLKPFLKRNPTGSFSLVAYSLESSAIDIFYSDGIAYAGDSSKWPYGSVTTDITFVIENTEIITTATTSGVTLDSDTLFYIRPTADQILPVGFTGNGITAPDDAVTTNFIFYGTYLMWEYSDGSLSDSFRAKETNVTGVYELYYDFSNLYPSGYKFPVVKSSS